MPKLTLEVFDDGRGRRKPLVRSINDGLQGNYETLKIAADFVRRDSRQPDWRAFVTRRILKGVRGHDYRNEVQACFEFARDSITYRRDPVGVERVSDLWSTLCSSEGDCLIKSTALATCLGSIGYIPFFIPIIQVPNDLAFNHIYVGVYADWGTEVDLQGNRYEPLDPTPEDAAAGWQAPAWSRMKYEIFE